MEIVYFTLNARILAYQLERVRHFVQFLLRAEIVPISLFTLMFSQINIGEIKKFYKQGWEKWLWTAMFILSASTFVEVLEIPYAMYL